MRTRIILVHGTFSSEKEFSDETVLAKECLTIDGADLEPFPWTSWNTQQARDEAAKELAAKISEGDVNERIILIGHSHGGVVVTRAVCNHLFGTAVNKVRGIVTFGTPFLHAKHRSAKRVQNVFAILRMFCIFLLMFVLLALKLQGLLSMALLAVGMFVIWSSASALQSNSRREAGETWFNLFTYCLDRLPCPCLCVYDDLDEAYWWLRWQPVPVNVLLVSLSVMWLVTPFLILAFPGAPLAQALGVTPPLLAILAAVASNMFQRHWWGIGRAPFATFLWLDVTAHRLPLGLGKVEAMEIDCSMPSELSWKSLRAQISSIRHCQYYRDHRVATAVVEWLSALP